MFDPFALLGVALPFSKAQLTGERAEAERAIEGLLRRLSDRNPSDPVSYAPFTIDKSAALAAFGQWLQGLRFVSAHLKRTADLGSLRKVYVPFWVVSAVSSGYYVGERGRRRSERETYTDSSGEEKTRSVQRTEWETAFGTVKHRFDNLPICAMPALSASVVPLLNPDSAVGQRTGPAKDITDAELEQFGLDARTAYARAQADMDSQLEDQAKRDIGGDEQKVNFFQSCHTAVTMTPVLVPAYLGTFTFRGKSYAVAIHGATGKVAGEAPRSVGKILILILAIVGGIAALIALLIFLLHR
jgi:hypothetical protein